MLEWCYAHSSSNADYSYTGCSIDFAAAYLPGQFLMGMVQEGVLTYYSKSRSVDCLISNSITLFYITMQRMLKIALLYTRSDLRAQGLLDKGLLSAGVLLIFEALVVIAMYRSAMGWLTGSGVPSVTMLSLIVVFIFFVMLYNALSVGQLTGTSGHSEFQAISSFPVSAFDVAKIRLFLGGLRAILFAIVFLGAVPIAVTVYHGVFSLQVLMSLLSLIILPIFPAAVGVYIALKPETTNLGPWLITIVNVGLVGFFLASRFPEPPQVVALFITVVNIPAHATVGALSPMHFSLFVGIWLGLAGIFGWGSIRRVVRLMNYVDTNTQSSMAVVRWALRTTRHPLFVLGSINAGRLQKFVFFWCLLLFVFVLFLNQRIITFSLPELPKMVAFVLIGTGAVILSLPLVLRESLGHATEYRALQHLPVGWRTIILAPFFVSTLVISCFAFVVFILLPLLIPVHTGVWIFVFFMTSLSGGGMTTLVTLLSRGGWVSALLWKGMPFYYMLLKFILFVVASFIIFGMSLWSVLILNIGIDLIVAIALWQFVLPHVYRQFMEVV